MGRRKNGRNMVGSGFGTDLLKKILIEASPLVGKLLEKPVQEVGNYLGNKIKKFTGGAINKNSPHISNQSMSYAPPIIRGKGYNLPGQEGTGIRFPGEKITRSTSRKNSRGQKNLLM